MASWWARAHPGPSDRVIRGKNVPLHNNTSEQSCSNLFVAAPVVARLNLNGQMSLLTRTERSVSCPMSLPPLNNSRPHRITSVIVSMPLLPVVGGRKNRTFIGTIVNLIHHKKSVRKRSVKSRRQRQGHFPSRCGAVCLAHYSFSLLDIQSHTHGFGPSKKETSSNTQGAGIMRYP
jgi:hypothetical protein